VFSVDVILGLGAGVFYLLVKLGQLNQWVIFYWHVKKVFA
jgi:hypothetical protein